MGFLIMGTPETYGRCDIHPANTYWERFRFYSIECTLTILFVSGTFNTSDPYLVTEWLNKWALFAYCFHVAFDRLIPRPYGALVSFGSVVLFYLNHKYLRRRSHRKENKGNAMCISEPG